MRGPDDGVARATRVEGLLVVAVGQHRALLGVEAAASAPTRSCRGRGRPPASRSGCRSGRAAPRRRARRGRPRGRRRRSSRGRAARARPATPRGAAIAPARRRGGRRRRRARRGGTLTCSTASGRSATASTRVGQRAASGSMLARRLLRCSPTRNGRSGAAPAHGAQPRRAAIVGQVDDVGVRHDHGLAAPAALDLAAAPGVSVISASAARHQHVELRVVRGRGRRWCGLRRSCTVKHSGVPRRAQRADELLELARGCGRRSRSAGGTRRSRGLSDPRRARAWPAATTAPAAAAGAARVAGRAAGRRRRRARARGGGRRRGRTARTPR